VLHGASLVRNLDEDMEPGCRLENMTGLASGFCVG
jgi:hypothetical protein